MQIQTKFLGELNIDEQDIVRFPGGLMGFEEHKEFILLDIPDNPHFKILQDIHEAYIGFIVINPWNFFASYDIVIPDDELKKIEIEDKKDLVLYNIVTLGVSFTDSTANLLAPVVININKRTGLQYILNNGDYTTKHPLFEAKAGV